MIRIEILLKVFKWSITFLTFFLVACSTLTGSLLKDPQVKIQSLSVKSFSLLDVSLDLELDVENPNPIPLNLSRVSYALSFSGEKVTEGLFEKGIDIPAEGTSKVVVPLKFTYTSINRLLNNMFNKSMTKDYELSGSTRIGVLNIPFAKKGQINLLK